MDSTTKAHNYKIQSKNFINKNLTLIMLQKTFTTIIMLFVWLIHWIMWSFVKIAKVLGIRPIVYRCSLALTKLTVGTFIKLYFKCGWSVV